MKANPKTESNDKLFEYSQWCWKKKTAKTRETRTFILEKKNGTLINIITLFAKQLDGLPYYIKPGESTITTEEHIKVSDDLNHDKFAVRKFHELSVTS